MALRPDPVVLRSPASGGSGNGSNNMYCLIQSVDMDTKIAHVRNQLGGLQQVSMDRMLGRSVGFPKPGETWMITSLFGAWMFAVQVHPSFADYVYDDDARLADTGWVTTGGTAVNGSTIVTEAYRAIGSVVSISIVLFLGTAITVPSTGNILNTEVWQVPAAFVPSGGAPAQSLSSATFGSASVGRIGNTGSVALTATTPNTDLSVGAEISLSGVYFK